VRRHLVLTQPRDVIEFPIEGEIDAGGWDLRKALLLALGGNAVIAEWVKSPIVYEEIPDFRQSLLEILDRVVDPIKVAQHYLGLARSHVARLGKLSGDVHLKKLFYLIRPIVALDWMEQRHFATLPPMALPDCLADTELPLATTRAIRGMIDQKAETREMGTGPIPAPIADYLERRYAHHEKNIPDMRNDAAGLASRHQLAEDFYRQTIERLG
jgi:predicted nucleotidyltransferase